MSSFRHFSVVYLCISWYNSLKVVIIMYLKQNKSHGRIYLSFVQGYRNEDGKIKHKTIQKLGYLDDLKIKFDDPISHFKDIAKQIVNYLNDNK